MSTLPKVKTKNATKTPRFHKDLNINTIDFVKSLWLRVFVAEVGRSWLF